MTDQEPPKRRIRDRSTSDILVLMIALTICGSVLLGGGTIIVVELVTSGDADTNQPLRAIGDVINTLIGLLAGFLAGRTDATQSILKARQEAEAEAREKYRPQEPPQS